MALRSYVITANYSFYCQSYRLPPAARVEASFAHPIHVNDGMVRSKYGHPVSNQVVKIGRGHLFFGVLGTLVA